MILNRQGNGLPQAGMKMETEVGYELQGLLKIFSSDKIDGVRIFTYLYAIIISNQNNYETITKKPLFPQEETAERNLSQSVKSNLYRSWTIHIGSLQINLWRGRLPRNMYDGGLIFSVEPSLSFRSPDKDEENNPCQ